MIVVAFTPTEISAIAKLIDLAVKANGISAVGDAALVVAKLDAAITEAEAAQRLAERIAADPNTIPLSQAVAAGEA